MPDTLLVFYITSLSSHPPFQEKHHYSLLTNEGGEAQRCLLEDSKIRAHRAREVDSYTSAVLF